MRGATSSPSGSRSRSSAWAVWLLTVPSEMPRGLRDGAHAQVVVVPQDDDRALAGWQVAQCGHDGGPVAGVGFPGRSEREMLGGPLVAPPVSAEPVL